MRIIKQDAQTNLEFSLLIFVFVLIGYTGFKIIQRSLNGYFNKIAEFRAGNPGMLP
jgi:uncharacterized protein (UPF0333 family)